MDFMTSRHNRLIAGTVVVLGCALGGPCQAYEYTFADGVKVEFQNTLQYSVLERTAPESSFLASQINNNDGDNNLRAGIVSNRFDLLSKIDISDNGFGFDASADSFYDTVYNQNTQNSDAFTYNPASEPPSKFTSEARTAAGRNIELRNLFVYGSKTIAGVPVTLRVGRLVNIFGESLFFAANGIAYGNAPLDIARAESVPNTQAKDLFLPVDRFDIDRFILPVRVGKMQFSGVGQLFQHGRSARRRCTAADRLASHLAVLARRLFLSRRRYFRLGIRTVWAGRALRSGGCAIRSGILRAAI